MNSFHGKTILVTGANRGIGLAFVETLLKAGAGKILAAARKPESLNELVANGPLVSVARSATSSR